MTERRRKSKGEREICIIWKIAPNSPNRFIKMITSYSFINPPICYPKSKTLMTVHKSSNYHNFIILRVNFPLNLIIAIKYGNSIQLRIWWLMMIKNLIILTRVSFFRNLVLKIIWIINKFYCRHDHFKNDNFHVCS